MRRLPFLAATLLLVACPEPPDAPQAVAPPPSGPVAPPEAPAAADGDQPMPSGDDAPTLPSAEAPPAGAGGDAPPPGQQMVAWVQDGGDSVTLSGTVSYAGSQTGTVRLDFLKADGTNQLAHSMLLDQPGAWTVDAPEGAGEVHVVAFIDRAFDGPSTDDPAGRTTSPIDIGRSDVSGVDITLSDDADLGEFAPGKKPRIAPQDPPEAPPATE